MRSYAAMQTLDVQKLRLIDEPAGAAPDHLLECDLLVAGGGMGGCAAALAACRAGRSVVLTEETDWLGGQMTSQGVSALDEHRYVEQFGGTSSYVELREQIRRYYRSNFQLAPEAAADPALNPGGGWVSHLCFEPQAGLWALDQLLQPHREAGRLTVLLRHRAAAAEVRGDLVRAVTFRHLDGPERVQIRARFVLDATELGDLLPLTGTEYVVGAEGTDETGEPHARMEGAAPGWVQSFTYPFALERRESPAEPVPAPEGYAENRGRQPYTLRHLYYDERGWVAYRMFGQAEETPGSFWEYRRLVRAESFRDPRQPRDVAMINWPGNDFRHGRLIDVEPEEALDSLRRAKALSLGFCRWLQTECPRDDGGSGYPELALRPDVMGSADGLSKYPYIRESRRIRSLRPVVEQEISAACQPGPRAQFFGDSVGIGYYPIDIHPAEGEEKIPPAATWPFQIPLSTLVPVRMKNLLPACKNLGVTHITNGAYRLHPVEWNIGEAAALLAVFCMDRGISPQAVAGDAGRIRRLQRRLARAGVPLYWFVDVPPGHPDFEAAQLLAAWGLWCGGDRLEFGPDTPADGAILASLSRAQDWARPAVEQLLNGCLAAWSSLTRSELAAETYAVLAAEATRSRKSPPISG